MKNKMVLLSVSVVSLMSAQIAVAAEVSVPTGWKFGFSLDQHESGGGAAVEVFTPSMVFEDELKSHLGLFVGLGTIETKNAYVNERGNYASLSSSMDTVGVNWLVPQQGGLFTNYAQFAAVYLSPDSKLSKKGDWGGKIAMGIEFPVPRKKDVWLASQAVAVFVQHAVVFGLESAQEIAGKPDLFNGSATSIGARVYF